MAYSQRFGYYTEAEEFYKEPEEAKPEYVCSDCGQELYEGDRVWSFERYKYCGKCAEDIFSKLV